MTVLSMLCERVFSHWNVLVTVEHVLKKLLSIIILTTRHEHKAEPRSFKLREGTSELTPHSLISSMHEYPGR